MIHKDKKRKRYQSISEEELGVVEVKREKPIISTHKSQQTWENPLERWLDQYDGKLPEEIVSKCRKNECEVSENHLSITIIDVGSNEYKINVFKFFSYAMYHFLLLQLVRMPAKYVCKKSN